MLNRLDRISAPHQLLLIWTFPVTLVAFFVGMIPLSGFIPPPSPTDSAQEIVAFYTENLTSLRFGLVVAALSFTLVFAWAGAIASLMARIEGGFPGLTFTAMLASAAGLALTFLIFLIWTVAAFRPTEYAPETVLMLNDLGWFCFLWIVPPFSLWSAAWGLVILKDKKARPTFPRWVAYVCFWEAVMMETCMLIGFFKTGAFAFNGLFGFYLPVFSYFVWSTVMTIYAHKAVRRQEQEQDQEQEATGVGLPVDPRVPAPV